MAALGKPFSQRVGLAPVGFQMLAGDPVALSYSGRVISLRNSLVFEQQINLRMIVKGRLLVGSALKDLFGCIASGGNRDLFGQR